MTKRYVSEHDVKRMARIYSPRARKKELEIFRECYAKAHRIGDKDGMVEWGECIDFYEEIEQRIKERQNRFIFR